MCFMATTVNTVVWYIWKLIREKILKVLITRKKNCNYLQLCGDRCELDCSDAQSVINPPETQETWVWSLSWEEPLEKEMATYSSILACKILWTEEPGGLQFMRLQGVRDNLATKPLTTIYHVAHSKLTCKTMSTISEFLKMTLAQKMGRLNSFIYVL